MVAQLVDQHVTMLASANPVDVQNSDRHTVKPWFQGKLPFSFNLPDLAGSSFSLLGGKAVYARQRPGAELVYQAGQHRISVFVFQQQDEGTRTVLKPHFNVANWTEGGLHFYVVTDAGQEESGRLVRMFQEANRS
jgi:anti-sigma factor RsiW